MRDFKLILKVTLEWIGIFSFLWLVSLKIDFNLVDFVLKILIISELMLYLSSTQAKKIYNNESYIHNYVLNFLVGIIVFGSMFYFLMGQEKLTILYICYEMFKLLREFLYSKRLFPHRYYTTPA